MVGRRNINIFGKWMSSQYFFSSHFEEKKTIQYLCNLINSRFVIYKTEDIFEFSIEVLGGNKLEALIKTKFPHISIDDSSQNLTADILIKLLREDVMPLLIQRIKKLFPYSMTDTEKRLLLLQKTFRLTDEESEIVAFFYLAEISGLIERYLLRADFLDSRNVLVFKDVGNILLGLKRASFLRAFSAGNILKAHILDSNRQYHGLRLTDWCINYISEVGRVDLNHKFFAIENNKTLEISDFDIPDDELMVLHTLMKSRKKQDLLLYGEPGTGKTAFAKTIARHYKKELLSVKIPETDSVEDWQRAIYATVNLAENYDAVVLIDEADELLNSFNSFSFKKNTSKGWINSFLDYHNQKIIWITNHTAQIDPSTIRRFSFSIEFRRFNAKNRIKVLENLLKNKKFSEYFRDEELTRLCEEHSVNASGIVNALEILNISKKTRKDVALRQIRTVLENHEKATGRTKYQSEKRKNFEDYSLKGLNTSMDPEKIISAICTYEQRRKDSYIRTSNTISLLLYGLSGTGKSEFVYYLGKVIKKEVLLKRASEIHSMWVGETEKNIARAFYEAQKSDSILFFDEADTFLYPRKDASHSWEKSFTNEILTRLESFNGIVVFATNDIDGLDNAALRRFRFKIEFNPLTPEGNFLFYKTILRPFVRDKRGVTDDETARIKAIKNLTPGDFAVVKDQCMFIEPSSITHQMLIEALINEVKYKRTGKAGIGF